jgi:hypothetical protein
LFFAWRRWGLFQVPPASAGSKAGIKAGFTRPD